MHDVDPRHHSQDYLCCQSQERPTNESVYSSSDPEYQHITHTLNAQFVSCVIIFPDVRPRDIPCGLFKCAKH